MLESLVLGLHLFSQHQPNRDGVNNENYGIYAKSEDGWKVGAYKNTYRRWTAYGGKEFTYQAETIDADASLLIGVATGYKKREIEIDCPTLERRWHKKQPPAGYRCYETQGFSNTALAAAIAPSVRYQAVRLTVLPRIGKTPAVWHLGVEHKFTGL